MAGLVGIGSQLNKNATSVYGDAAGLESTRNKEGEMAKDAEKTQEVGMASSGLATGAMIGAKAGTTVGPWGTVIGGTIGAIAGWLGSKAV